MDCPNCGGLLDNDGGDSRQEWSDEFYYCKVCDKGFVQRIEHPPQPTITERLSPRKEEALACSKCKHLLTVKEIEEIELAIDASQTSGSSWGRDDIICAKCGEEEKAPVVLARADSTDTTPKLEELKAYLDKKFAAVHRNIHSGDKVAKVLVDLVEKVNEVQDQYVWGCPVCGNTFVCDAEWVQNNSGPGCANGECVETGRDLEADHLVLFDTPEWIAAEEFVLRIKRVKEKAKDE